MINLKFIYALNEDDRQELITKGFKELFSCYIGEKKAYAFDSTSRIAVFSQEDKKKFLFTNMAYF
nr:MAG TPA: hypothetical protein [Siphoviridae sp. ctBWu8]